MAPSTAKLYIPPFAGVRLYECRDHITLALVPAYREFFAYSKAKATEVVIQHEDGTTELFWDDCEPEEEVWAVIQWARYEDGHEEKGSYSYLRSPNTEDDARKEMERMIEFYSTSKAELLKLNQLFKSTEEDQAYIESRYPNYLFQPHPSSKDDFELYQARLKVLAGLQPKTVGLIEKANRTEDSIKRRLLEREAVEAYFAEVATYWPNDMIKAWLRSNPAGAEWLCEFGRVMEEPERQLDPINHELALNWIRRGYNLMTENELSDAIWVMTGQRLMPNTLKKKRGNLGLSTKRSTGPRPNSEL